MKKAAEQDEFDGAMFATAAGQFVPLLRQHIFKENNILFKMAGNVLSESDDAALNAGFTEVEHDRELAGLYKQFEADIDCWEEAMK